MFDERRVGGGDPEGEIEITPERPLENPPADSGSALLKERIEKIKADNPGSGSQQSLAAQLCFLMETRNNLCKLENDLVVAGNSVICTIQELVNRKYFGELRAEFEPFVIEFESQLKRIFAHLDEKHIDYLRRQADAVAAVLQNLNRKS